MTKCTNELPMHLRQYIAEQNYSLYTPIDHASWRYIMRVSKEYFRHHAHPKYLEGLIETGVTVDRIPLISEMDQKLQKFGWRAVIITGFIPPEPFLEMLAHRILPIAADMRKLENIDYTPAPDIVHEAAGHAPILADPAYSSYLMKFGEIARRVIYAKEDNELYEAVLNLSETKEEPNATEEQIALAQKGVEEAAKRVGYVSEAQQVTRLGWWSTEYGLFERNGNYLIYGAGLLSSVGESYNCLSPQVKKVPLTIECVETAFDITKPQPQLFVTDDFKKLEKIIDELSEKMAFKRGGVESLVKAKRAETLTTTCFESGIQVSGILEEYKLTAQGEVSFIKFKGPCQLSVDEVQLEGHGPEFHSHGFSSPVGSIVGLKQKTWLATAEDWQSIGCRQGAHCTIEFESGIKVDGRWISSATVGQNTVVMTFEGCAVKNGSELLFQPEWGTFDMVLGEKVVSVFGGAADRESYAKQVYLREFKPRPQKSNLTEVNKELAYLYGIIRDIRETGKLGESDLHNIHDVAEKLDEKYGDDWLLRLEILELVTNLESEKIFREKIKNDLDALATKSPRNSMLISRGLRALD